MITGHASVCVPESMYSHWGGGTKIFSGGMHFGVLASETDSFSFDCGAYLCGTANLWEIIMVVKNAWCLIFMWYGIIIVIHMLDCTPSSRVLLHSYVFMYFACSRPCAVS